MTKNKRMVPKEVWQDRNLEKTLLLQMEDKALNVLKWNCPTWEKQIVPVPPCQIEKLCYENGMYTVFLDDKTGEYYILPVVSENIEYSAYGLPTKWRPFAQGVQGGRFNGLTLTNDNAVLGYNDDTHTPTADFVKYCVKRMVQIERNIENNLICMRNQLVWIVDDYTVLSSKLLQEKREEGVLNIMRVSNMDTSPVAQIQNLNVKYDGNDYCDLYNRYLNLAYAHMGLDSIQIDKKERVLNDEVNAGNDSTSVMRYSRLKYRLQAVDRMRELWPDLDVSVGINPDLLKEDALTADDDDIKDISIDDDTDKKDKDTDEEV